jgi:tryptophan synthase alpha chain
MTRSTVGSKRIERAFAAARENGRIAFVPYVVAGYPNAAVSEDVALVALDAGADLIEIGLPYSDPLADGVTLQRSSAAALANGHTLDDSFALVERVARRRPDKPVLVMGYVNQFMGPRGSEAVAKRLAGAGASGAIVPDLTPDEGQPLEEAFESAGLALVYLATPTSSAARIEVIGSRSGGFVYCVSLTGVTGARQGGPTDVSAIVAQIKQRSTLPVGVGFGVSEPKHVQSVVATGADGVIVGSALVDSLGADGSDIDGFGKLCASLARATSHVTAAA